MVNIERLRSRLKNVNKGTTEYRMTVDEAKNLLTEIDQLIDQLAQTKIITPVEETKQALQINIDGGEF